MDEADGQQLAQGLEIEAPSFHRVHRSEADDDALPPRIQRLLQRGQNLALRGLLRPTLRRQGDDELQGFGERRRRRLQRGLLMRHLRPFYRDGLPDIVTRQPTQLGFLLRRQAAASGRALRGAPASRLWRDRCHPRPAPP